MAIFIASDFHCKYQKVAWMDSTDGELHIADVHHQDVNEVAQFFRQFPAGSILGMETSGYSHWFEELVVGLGLELRIGNSQVIAGKRPRRQKNDQLDAEHMLCMLLENRFPTIWRPTPENREKRVLIRQRCRLVKMRTQLINALRALVYNHNLHLKRGQLSKKRRQQIADLAMSPILDQQRREMLGLIEQLDVSVKAKEAQIEQWARQDEAAARLLTIPGVGACTALTAVLILGPVGRFPTAKKVVSYIGLACSEHSTNNGYQKRRYGQISKQGNKLLRWLLTEASGTAIRTDVQRKRYYARLKYRKDWRVAKTAVARKILVCIYVLLRDGIDYPEFLRRGPSFGMPAETAGRK